MKIMVNIKNIAFSYSHHKSGFQIRIPSIEIEAGSKVALTGPSGTGKTTLINLITGILTPESGWIYVSDNIINRMNDTGRRKFRLKNIGMVFQTFELLSYLSVEENVLLPCLMDRSLYSKKIQTYSRQLLETIGIYEKRKRYPEHLSQGERQRVAICRALVMDPVVILADEPTGNLDEKNSHNALNLILNQVDNRKTTFIMSTHNKSLLNHFDKIIDISQFSEN